MWRYLLFLIFLTIFLYFLIDKYFIISEEEKVKKVIHEAKTACENEDLEKISRILDKNYYDNFGHNYERLLIRLYNIFNQYDEIKIYFLKERIKVDNSLAVCSLSVRAIGLALDIKEYEVFYKDLLTLYLKKDNNWHIYYDE